MKIFPTQETSRISDTREAGAGDSVKKGGKGRKRAPAAKPALSENDIREKLATHVETSNTAKSGILKKNSQKLGDGFMNPEIKPIKAEIAPKPANATALATALENSSKAEIPEEKSEAKEDAHLLKTDINLNDPKDPNTQEKLKTVLTTGAFSFNPKERETLEKILNGN